MPAEERKLWDKGMEVSSKLEKKKVSNAMKPKLSKDFDDDFTKPDTKHIEVYRNTIKSLEDTLKS